MLTSHVDQIKGVKLKSSHSLYSDFFNFSHQSSAYFLFQQGVECYEGRKGGRVHYAPQKTPLGTVNLVFIDPLCQGADLPELLSEFDASQCVPNLYVCVSSRVAKPLRQRGYAINQIGAESKITLANFHVHGKKKKQLRHASHFGERNNCTVKELPWSEVDEAQVKDVSLAWLRSKGVNNRELRYATRPPVYGDEWQVRKFYCFHEGKVIAYVFFDPYFEDGKILGYCANILRARPEKACNGALDYTILEALKVFQDEGVPELSLGVAPFSNIQSDPDERPAIRVFSQFFYDYGSYFYACKGLAYHKSRYRPIETPWYLCSKDIGLVRLYWALLFGLKVAGGREI